MAKASMDMIEDVLKWDMGAEQKLAFICQIVGGTAPAPAAKEKAAAKAPPKQRKTRKRRAPGTYRRAQLWAACKKANPAKIKSLNYSEVTIQDLEKILARARKAK